MQSGLRYGRCTLHMLKLPLGISCMTDLCPESASAIDCMMVSLKPGLCRSIKQSRLLVEHPADMYFSSVIQCLTVLIGHGQAMSKCVWETRRCELQDRQALLATMRFCGTLAHTLLGIWAYLQTSWCWGAFLKLMPMPGKKQPVR